MNKHRLLIIDDDQYILDAMQLLLSYLGYEVITALHANEVVGQLGYILPDLIIIDYLLSETDGSKVCQLIKSNPATSHLPVILMSHTLRPVNFAKTAEATVILPSLLICRSLLAA